MQKLKRKLVTYHGYRHRQPLPGLANTGPVATVGGVTPDVPEPEVVAYFKEWCEVVVRHSDGSVHPLALRQDLRYKSDGFEWGYGGSGPAQLAIALIAHTAGDGVAGIPYVVQEVKARIISRLARDGWTLAECDLRIALAEILKGMSNGNA